MYQSIFSKRVVAGSHFENWNHAPDLECVGIIGNVLASGKQINIDFSFSSRALMIAKYLQEFNIPVFLYSPANIDFSTNKIAGFCFYGNGVEKRTMIAPRVNADWLMNMRKFLDRNDVNYDSYINWRNQHNHRFFPSDGISAFAGNKKKTYFELQQIDQLKQPETEDVDNLEKQLASFLERHDLIFVKPQFGHRSEKVLVIEKSKDQFLLTYYPENVETTKDLIIEKYSDYKSLYNATSKLVGKEWYLIQQGIRVLRQNSNPLQFRTLMISNGQGWEYQEIVYVGLNNTHISNQPHYNHTDLLVNDVLNTLLTKDKAKKLQQHLQDLSFKVAQLCENKFPREINELAIDWVIDDKFDIYLLEINTKPSIISPNVYRKTYPSIILPEEEDGFNKFLIPYMHACAKFLHTRLTEARNAD